MGLAFAANAGGIDERKRWTVVFERFHRWHRALVPGWARRWRDQFSERSGTWIYRHGVPDDRDLISFSGELPFIFPSGCPFFVLLRGPYFGRSGFRVSRCKASRSRREGRPTPRPFSADTGKYFRMPRRWNSSMRRCCFSLSILLTAEITACRCESAGGEFKIGREFRCVRQPP